MNLTIQLDEKDLKQLVCDELQRKLGDITIDASKVTIEVKSKQNYKSEWESAAFRATFISQ